MYLPICFYEDEVVKYEMAISQVLLKSMRKECGGNGKVS